MDETIEARLARLKVALPAPASPAANYLPFVRHENLLWISGQLPLTPARVDVATLLPDIVDGLRGGLDVDRVRLEVQSPCPACLDPARFERIVVNLVSNALKYSSSDVQVVLTCQGGDAILTVSDKGIGISPDDQARIFERYYRARSERQPEGLGLGLYITRLLVEAQGGTVSVESQLGSGSTFRVRFPAAGMAS